MGLVFFVPGLNETLRARRDRHRSRVPGAALAIRGRLPILVLKVAVEEAYLHCAKALIRARVWEPEARPRRG